MNCPYCSKEMKKGKIYTASTAVPYWLEDGDKRQAEDVFTGRGLLPVRSALMTHSIESYYCPDCKKISNYNNGTEMKRSAFDQKL